MDEAEIRVERLLRSRPEMRSDLSTARISDVSLSRVVATRTVQNVFVPTGTPQSRSSNSVPEGTGVHSSLVLGTPARPHPVLIPNRVVTYLNSMGDSNLLLGSDPLALVSLPPITVGRNPTPNPSLLQPNILLHPPNTL